MDQVLIFVNPIAGRGRGLAIARSLEGRLQREGFAATVLDRRPGPGLAAPGEVRAAIVIGGDGTLRGVARWAIEGTGLGPCPPLLIVPMGTANLMGRHLGIRWDWPEGEDRIVRAIRQPRIVRLDAATANGQVFLMVAGVGYDAAIIHELERTRTGPIRATSYALPAVRALAGYEFAPLSVSVDGRPIFGPAPALAFVGNIPEYGTGFPVLPHARPDDQALDVCVVPCSSRWEMARMFMLAVFGQHVHAEGVRYVRGRSIRIDSPRPAPIELDGEAAGFAPLAIDLLDRPVPFIVPD